MQRCERTQVAPNTSPGFTRLSSRTHIYSPALSLSHTSTLFTLPATSRTMPKRKDSSTPSEEDFKPALSDEDVKPATKKSKSKAKAGAYPPGGKQALAELIIELGVKALPGNKEVAKMVSPAPVLLPVS